MYDDDVIPASAGKRVVLVVVCAAVLVVGVALAWWHNPLAIDAPFGRHQQRMFFVGGFLALGAAVALPFALVRLLVRRDLRITPEAVQLVDRRGRLTGNVPLANIARLELVGVEGAPSIRIWLADPRRTDTFWPGGRLARWWTRRESGCDITLSGAWAISVVELHRRLEERRGRVG